METPQQRIEKLTESIKNLQAENVKLKESIEKSHEKKVKLVQDIEKLSFKLSLQETTQHTEKQVLVKTQKELQEELEDYKKIAESDKDKLNADKEALLKVLEELKQKNEALVKQRDASYQALQKKQNEQKQKEKKEEEKKESGPLTLEEAVSSIKIEKEEEFLSYKTLNQIFDALALYINDEFCRVIDEFRNERRRNNYKNKQFVNSFLAFEQRTKDLMASRQKELMEKVGLTTDELYKSINYHASKGRREVLSLYPMLITRLRNFRESKRVLTKDEIKSILKAKEEMLILQREKLIELLKECNKAKLLPEQGFSLVQFRIADFIYQDFKTEEEDLTAALKNIENSLDPEIQELAMRATKASQEVFRDSMQGK